MADTTHMDTTMDGHDGYSGNEDEHISDCSQPAKPVKVRKKPGRKPNPASPALRKAQNRAAQRAFRERKERHLREMETVIKQVREHRDRLQTENEQLKGENDILKSENWYLKGIVLSLQLVCFQHNLVIPKHGPHINEQTLAVMAQSIPKHIVSYLDCNAKSKAPSISKLHGYTNHTKAQRDRFVSTGPTLVTAEDVQPLPHNGSMSASNWGSNGSSVYNPGSHMASNQISLSNLPELSPVLDPVDSGNTMNDIPALPRPVHLSNEPLTSNLAAIQALRLRLRLQAACAREKSLPFAIQPTLLQLAIPHDPRIDLIPTPHMRDRMILFRDQFNLDDCLRCLLSESMFHGGDPAVAANWELPPEFFEKYWFLTIDYTLRRMTNHWRKLQGLKEVDPPPGSDPINTVPQQPSTQPPTQPQPQSSRPDLSMHPNVPVLPQPSLEPICDPVSMEDLSSFLGIEFSKDANFAPIVYPQPPPYASSITSTNSSSSPGSTSRTNAQDGELFSCTPIRLTNGYMRMPYGVPHMPPSHSRTKHDML